METEPEAKKSRSMIPKGGDDNVFTPPKLAKLIVGHFAPTGKRLDPCKGLGAFTKAMPGCDWFEISEGKDFFAVETGQLVATNKAGKFITAKKWDWIITNPPWSQFKQFLCHSMDLADNVVFLAPINAWVTKSRMRDVREAGFGYVEALLVDTPPKPWPQTGFQLAALHIRRGYKGSLKLNYSVLGKKC